MVMNEAVQTQEERESLYTPEEIYKIADFATGALTVAHSLIVAAIQGKGIDPNALENYYCEMHDLVNAAGYEGVLIDAALEEMRGRIVCMGVPAKSTAPTVTAGDNIDVIVVGV